MRRACVFVHGDLGRSPRMQNHALELAATHQVMFMGYFDSSPRSQVIEHANIKLVDLQIKNLEYVRKISFYLYALVRIVLQILQILYLLVFKHRNLQFVLVQNPPAIPSLFAIWLASKFAKFNFYVDFHNYGYTILNLNIKNPVIIGLACKYQQFFGRKASRAWCVSDQMKMDLKDKWGIQAVTLYDRPVRKVVKGVKKNIFLGKYGQSEIKDNQLLLVSSTSWTKDQDFSILLDALEMYQKSEGTKFIRTYITGKGPQKQRYLAQISKRRSQWKKISVQALWLQADDYPILLSICDLGVCLHYSSSGLDLPMKVVDMFGAGIPVLAIQFPALPQLVKNGQTGFVFKNRQELFGRILELSQNDKLLKQLRKNVGKELEHSWSSEWKQKVRPLI